MKKFSVALLSLALPSLAFAQAGAAKSKNLIYNGSFESFWQADNLWDGVDTNGFLAGTRGTVKAVTERGKVDNVAMPLSVQAADMNGDGLVDLVTIDADDIIRIYFNSGTPQEPKFTHGEIVPVFLAQQPHTDSSIRKAYKIGVADLGRTGIYDIILGNYGGELMILKNMGSRTAPDFRQPADINRIIVPTNKDHLWGNLFAPAAADFSKTGRIDFLVGDGGYSANNIHLFINQGNGPAPSLSLENRQYLAYGDGREQLSPAVVDYNGDGNLDLIVGDRQGNLNLYLSKGAWNKDKELEFSSVISLGKTQKFNGAISPAIGDFTGNGLFDIAVGKTNGRIALALNKGTKEQPKFDDPVEIKGVDVWNRTTMRNPSDWSIDFGKSRGNMLGYFTVVKEQDDPEIAPLPPHPSDEKPNASVLKAGYFQPLNKVVRYQPLVIPGSNDPKITSVFGKPNEIRSLPGRTAQESAANADSNVLTIRKIIDGDKLRPNGNYAFSFKVKGRSVSKATWHFHYNGSGERGEAKIISRSQRGAVTKKQDIVRDSITEEQDFGVSNAWSTVSRTLNTRFPKERDLNDPSKFTKATYSGVLEIRLYLRPGEGVAYLDDVRLIAQ